MVVLATRAHDFLRKLPSRLFRGQVRARYVPAGPASHNALINALNAVAAQTSSARTVHDVLGIVVDSAKRFTGTEKVVLCLVDDSADVLQLDGSSILVRGSRAEHDEAWWGAWLPVAADRVFADGQPFFEVDDAAGAWCMAVPVKVQDHPLGVLCVINSVTHRLRGEQTAFLSILGAFAAASIENARLAEESRYALLAGERERISREMHDGIAQSLFSISLSLEVCKRQVMRDPARVARQIAEIQELLAGSQSEIRRYIYDLRPAKLQELGLAGAIEYWLHEISSDDSHKVSFAVNGEARHVGAELETCVYRVAREATTNAVKHARASNIRIELSYLTDGLSLTVDDDGCGFDVEGALAEGSAGRGMGLQGLQDRVQRAGGEVEIVSALGRGCAVRAHFPA